MRRVLILLFSIILSLASLLALLFTVKHGQASVNPPPPPNPYDQHTLSKLHPALLQLLEKNNQAEMPRIIVEWKRSDQVYQGLSSLPSQPRAVQRQSFVTTLQEDMEIHTGGLMKLLAQAERRGQAKDIQRFWISPIISLSASPSTIQSLARRDDVAFIRPDQKIILQEDISSDNPFPLTVTDAWLDNLDMIDVDKVQDIFNFNGSGVVVANIDTGVDYYHPALMKKYRGYNPNGIPNHLGNWYVVTDEPYTYPGDGYGHGTHTMGILVGDDGAGKRIGVAPGAKWIAVKAFTNQGYTYESWIHAAFQWIIAPNGDPNLAPDIVNNSWGSDNSSDERFRNDIEALRAAGIFTVFSAGNNGPYSGSINSPASYPESFSVGAVDSVKLPASFSSRGPSPWNEIKPEISAPGVKIQSAFPGGGYVEMSGTSMAAPHVAGVAALLLQANPNLSVDQLEQIVINSAEPLGNSVPNNDTGYGLVNAFTAVLQVTQKGLLRGTIVSADTNQAISYPTINISNRDPINPIEITISGDQNGFYQIALIPGIYDIAFSAFGYESKTVYSQTIIANETITVNASLSPLPRATLNGHVFDATASIPLSATISVEDIPINAQTNSSTGAYQLSLPSGTYTLTVQAEAHRIQHRVQTVQSGEVYTQDFFLEPAPRILLVDSGAWYYNSEIDYYEKALKYYDYPYHEWTIHHPYSNDGFPDDRPTTSTLSAYDLVIWSAPLDSPGLLNLGSVISTYLTSGGNLLLSGEDIAYFDGGGPSYNPEQGYFIELLGLRYLDEGNLGPLSGIPTSAFADSHLELNTPDSAQNQTTPDSVTILNDLTTKPILSWSDQKIGAAISESCVPFKAMWLGFGLEGSGPTMNRLNFFNKALDWFTANKPSYSFLSKAQQSNWISKPGSIITATFHISNNGAQTDTYDLNLSGNTWDTSIFLQNSSSFSDYANITIPACQSQILTATIHIPPDALRDERSDLLLNITSQSNPNLTSTLTASAKTPAPILIVDDQLFYDHLIKYSSALEGVSNPYDIYKTNGFYSPPTNTLTEYPLVVWVTGYDWYSTLSQADEKQLTEFLNQGNGLFLSSQDVLDIRGVDDFFRTKMGVSGATLSVTPTLAIVKPNNSLNLPPKAAPLTFPYPNWGDAIIKDDHTEELLYDQYLNTIGILHPIDDARSAFFAFPLETMPDYPRDELINKTLFWLSPFGNTRFNFPGAVASGGELPIEILLQRHTPTQGVNKMVFPIPNGTNLLSNSIQGEWSYSPDQNALIWQGNLPANQIIPLKAGLQISSSIPPDQKLLLMFHFYDQLGFLINYQQAIPINQSAFQFTQEYGPHRAQPGDIVTFTLTITNTGVLFDNLILTETLKDGFQLIEETLQNQSGTIDFIPLGFLWHLSLSPNERTVLQYQARVTQAQPGGFLYSRSDWRSSFDSWLAYARIDLPWLYYFPFVAAP